MAAEEHDHIVARIGRSQRSTSTGALAAHLARVCGHVLVDESVVRRGYRFHPEIGDEIPAFFLKRVRPGRDPLTITLQGGLDLAGGDEPFAGCATTADVLRELDASATCGDDVSGHESLWRARIGIGPRTLTVAEIADPLFLARNPEQFRALAEELVAAGAVQRHVCPMCSEQDADDAAADEGPGMWIVDDGG